MNGKKEGTVTFKKLLSSGWRWITEHSTTIFNEEGKPVSAIISYVDVTEQQEKELAYKRWQQSISERDPNTYTLFRCNLNKNASYDTWDGELLSVKFDDAVQTFNDRTASYASQCVYEGDREQYLAFVNSDTMLAEYYRNHRSDSLEYREKMPDGRIRWLKLSIDLVEAPHSKDVEAYMLYENIDEQKKAELEAKHLAETDPLTGLLNRNAFSVRVNEVIQKSRPGTCHAFLMLDIDGFKMLNDTFGHAAGDQALIDTAHRLQALLRKGDLLGRLGGDEFVLFLSNVSSEESIAKKAAHICRQLTVAYSAEIRVTASIGISLYPRDGEDSHALYEKADTALYTAKGNGRDTYQIFCADLPEKSAGENARTTDTNTAEAMVTQVRERRMLIVSDSEIDRILLKNMFENEYLVDVADDGISALSRIRYFGSALSVMLLALNMTGRSGFDILEKAKASAEMRGVPIIVISEENDIDTCIRAVRSGAADFVTKPIQPELIRLRISAAINRAENERLRAQNSFLQLRGEEISRYQTALDEMGIFVVEMDWIKGTFIYGSAISHYLKGTYDGRPFWNILLSDMAADTAEVKRAQAFLQSLAGDPDRDSASLDISLKTPADETHRFSLYAKKVTNTAGHTQRLIMTFRDLNK